MKNIIIAVAAVLFLSQTSQAGIKVEKKPLSSVAKAAIVSVTIDNIGSDSASDVAFMAAAGDHALAAYGAGLKALGKWEMQDAPGIAELEASLSDLASSPITVKVLDALAAQNKLPGAVDPKDMMALAMASMSGKKDKLEALKAKLISSVARELQTDLNDLRAKLAWPKAAAGIPYGLLNKRKDFTPKEDALRTIIDLMLQDYCAKNGLDGVLLVHLASLTGTPKDIRVIVGGNRVLSSLKVNPTVLLRNKAGEIAIDAGQPRLDDLAPMKMAMPVFVGEKLPNGTFGNFKVDLDDPAGKVKAAYNELIKNTAEDLLKDLGKKLK